MTAAITATSPTRTRTRQADPPQASKPEPRAEQLATVVPIQQALKTTAVEQGESAQRGLEDFSGAANPKSSATTQNHDPARHQVRKAPARGLAAKNAPEPEAAARPAEDPVQVTSQINIRSNARSRIGLGQPRERDNFQFRGARQDAVEYPARVGDHRFSIVVPAGPKAAEQAMDIARSLSRLSPEALGNVDRVVKNPVQNPDDAFWAQQYNMPDFESAMTAGRDGTITIYPAMDDRLDRAMPSLAHEIGHIASKRAWGENYNRGEWNRWQQAAQADGSYASDYATRSPGEDFAETYSLYIRSQGTSRHDRFRQQFPNRFAIIDRMLGVTD